MKPAPTTLVQIDDLPGEEIEFGIGDPRFVMQTQADLYSDVTTAIIREYSTNAYDAHVMAGHRDPIEVTLPTHLSPTFVVRDHGVGMNRDFFKKIYTQFGMSNKRDDNSTNGSWGYGSKSGVAYTSQFEVTSVRDGIRTEAVVLRRPDWSIILKVVSQSHTIDSNGTTIKIPVHNVDEFVQKAHDFYKFWLPGRVLLNGVEPHHHVGEKITDNLYYSKEWNTSYVVLGNVAYRIANPDALFRNGRMNRLSFVAYADNIKMADGAQPVEYTPSREDLKYTDRTKATLQRIVDTFEVDIIAKAKKEIDAATTHAEAYTAWSHWTSTLGRTLFADLSFKGDKFEQQFDVTARRWATGTRRNAVQSISNWPVEKAKEVMVVHGFGVQPNSSVKAKVGAWLDHKGLDEPKYVLFVNGPALDSNDSKWVDWNSVTQISWATMKSETPKAVRERSGDGYGYGRVTGSWDYYTASGMEYEKAIPSDAKEIYYVRVDESKHYGIVHILQLLNSEATVLLCSANRLGKLLRENPQVRPFITMARDHVVKDGKVLLSDLAKKAMNVHHSWVTWANRLDLDRIDDPRFAENMALALSKDSLMKDYKDNVALANAVGMGYNGGIKYEPSQEETVVTEYPLLSGHHYEHEHIYRYINMIYKETQS